MLGETPVSPYLASGLFGENLGFPCSVSASFPRKSVSYLVNSVRFPHISRRGFPYFPEADCSASPYGEFYILLTGYLLTVYRKVSVNAKIQDSFVSLLILEHLDLKRQVKQAEKGHYKDRLNFTVQRHS